MMNSFTNKKELDHGFLTIEESIDNDGIKDVTLFYYPDVNKKSLSDWQSQIIFEVKMYNDIQGYQTVKIWDFFSKTENSGYGTIVLKEFFNYLKRNYSKPLLIIGELTKDDEIDEINKQRRNHIYEKFGFEIVENSIKKIINDKT